MSTTQILGKRDQTDDATDFDRFSKRLHMLTIGGGDPNGNSNFYCPISSASQKTVLVNGPRPQTLSNNDNGNDDGLMSVEDTRDRVFIRDLDEELADMEPDEERLIFLPDIEKHFSRIPKSVLTGRRDGDNEHQEVVLYSVPKSLSVDESQDSVRKAILETRQRAREKAAELARHEDMARRYEHGEQGGMAETAHGYRGSYVGGQEEQETDPDCMDID